MLDRSRSRDRSKTGGAFSPAGLFVSGAQGAWYDPSDFSTLYQDSTGTTPVTAVEQPVGLMLDKSGRGNHASQATSASRPVLQARYNLLTYSEEFDNAAWVKEQASVTANAGVAPDGTTTADKLVEDNTANSHNAYQLRLQQQTAYTLTVFAKAAERQFVALQFADTAATRNRYTVIVDLQTGAVTDTRNTNSPNSASHTVTSVGNGWYRISITQTNASSGNTNVVFVVGLSDTGTPSYTAAGIPTYTGDGTSGILIWGAQLLTAADAASTGGAYQRIAAATDYDVSNPVFRPYLAFDGVDDSFGTSSIDFSGTDEVTLFAGVTKLSDAATAAFVELSADANSNNGAFLAFVPGTNDFRFYSKGTTLRFASSGTVAAPVTRVYTGQGDILGNSAVLRLNGVQVGSDLLNQGTGNYGNYPLFIGRRNNASLPFNGRLYSLAVLGRTATAAELTAMETWVAGKTGVTL